MKIKESEDTIEYCTHVRYSLYAYLYYSKGLCVYKVGDDLSCFIRDI